MYIFNCEYGEIETISIDMGELRKRVKEWETKYPPPEIPLVAPDYTREKRDEMYEIKNALKLTRKKAIEEWRTRQDKVPNPKDKEYLIKKKKHDTIKYWFMLKATLLMGVLINGKTFEKSIIEGDKDVGLIPKIMTNAKAAQDLYMFITGNSELSNFSVTKQIELLEVTWNEMPILEAIKMLPKGKVSSSWNATGLMAAKSMGAFSEFSKMSIVDQSKLIAVYLVDNWVKSLSAKEASDNAKNNRSNKPKY